jgi:toxin YhaV
VIQRNGWNLLFHECLVEQLQKLHAAAERAQKQGPQGSESNANVLLFAALSKLIFEAVPSDPNRDEYRQGNTMGAAFRHWRRAKIGRRFRLFFRFDSKARIIIFAWVNDENTLRASGSTSDP